MTSALSLNQLPDLPQVHTLVRAAKKIWNHADVVAIWIGGSLACGGAASLDRVSPGNPRANGLAINTG